MLTLQWLQCQKSLLDKQSILVGKHIHPCCKRSNGFISVVQLDQYNASSTSPFDPVQRAKSKCVEKQLIEEKYLSMEIRFYISTHGDITSDRLLEIIKYKPYNKMAFYMMNFK